MMLYPALSEATTDPDLTKADVRILAYLCTHLSVGEYRTVKHWHVAKATRMSRQMVTVCMKRLVGAGYLRAGPRQERRIGSYMLVLSRETKHFARTA